MAPQSAISRPSQALMERMVDGGANLLRDDDSLLRQMFFSVLRYPAVGNGKLVDGTRLR